MANHQEHAELVKQAQLGDKECLNRLAEVARLHLRQYVLRLTLQEDLTQDIVQESILEMFKVFNKMKKADRFWSWLDGIAFNKVRSHYGRQWRHKTVSLSQIDREVVTEDSQNALADMVNQELKQIVLRSMLELAPRHRAVLTMRCYKEMPYSEIARFIGCTEFGAQSLFYRAKKALAKKLSSHGLGKGYLLAALVLFGKMTATTEAAAAKVTVTAATLKVGAAASLAAMATSKTAVLSLVTAGVIAGGTAAIVPGTGKINDGPQRPETQTSFGAPGQTDAGKGMEQCWYYFPEGAGNPAMMRLLKFSASGRYSYCRYLQNQHANYYYDENTISINNFRMYSPDLSVRRLPTDGKELSQFISQVEGKLADMEYPALSRGQPLLVAGRGQAGVSSKGKGLLVISKRSGSALPSTSSGPEPAQGSSPPEGTEGADRIWRIDRHPNVLEEEYFQFDWPQSATVVDNRDAMHKRGWTYFRMAGQVNGEKVCGTGRMPFVYATSKPFSPWLTLQLADGSKIVDDGAQACVLDASGKAVATYAGGSFFAGLGRPWMGLHTIDTVRRDAAEEQVWFETERRPDSGISEIVLTCDRVASSGAASTDRLVYTIDMEADVVEKITFSTGNGGQGELSFSYLQNIDNVGGEFVQPKLASYRQPRLSPPGVLWLAKLTDNRW